MKLATTAMDAFRARAPSRERVGAGLLGASLGLVPATWAAAVAAGPGVFLVALGLCAGSFFGGVAVVNRAPPAPEHVVVPVEADALTTERDPPAVEAPAA
ncbi:MAG TPA: hypothetical protein VM889_10580 [Candidatus Thermoplasmatota archaeon]|nr:hypothetical protein [Candidatus Thermoplasmatota archaeon]